MLFNGAKVGLLSTKFYFSPFYFGYITNLYLVLPGRCVDGINNYTCICDLGYDGRNCEHDIDDCASTPCVHGKCVNCLEVRNKGDSDVLLAQWLEQPIAVLKTIVVKMFVSSSFFFLSFSTQSS